MFASKGFTRLIMKSDDMDKNLVDFDMKMGVKKQQQVFARIKFLDLIPLKMAVMLA